VPHRCQVRSGDYAAGAASTPIHNGRLKVEPEGAVVVSSFDHRDARLCGQRANREPLPPRAAALGRPRTPIERLDPPTIRVLRYNGHQGDHMRISTVREFRDGATTLLRSRDPILVTRRGRLAGVFFPQPEASLPLELKRELFATLSAEVARQIKRRGLAEADVTKDFAAWRKERREARRRR